METQYNENGLIEGLQYHRKENGKIDWRKMIPPKYLVPNKQYFEKRKQAVPKSIEGLTDKQLLILLDGIKYVANLRGYDSITYPIVNSNLEYCTAVCQIDWMPNLEDPNGKISSGIGDATLNNTNSFAKYYLGAIAENRSFVRCVRNFLGIEIIAADEIGETPDNERSNEKTNSVKEKSCKKLEGLMEVLDYDFEDIKTKLINFGVVDIENTENIREFPLKAIGKAIEFLDRK